MPQSEYCHYQNVNAFIYSPYFTVLKFYNAGFSQFSNFTLEHCTHAISSESSKHRCTSQLTCQYSSPTWHILFWYFMSLQFWISDTCEWEERGKFYKWSFPCFEVVSKSGQNFVNPGLNTSDISADFDALCKNCSPELCVQVMLASELETGFS